jgi:hypothetical protein
MNLVCLFLVIKSHSPTLRKQVQQNSLLIDELMTAPRFYFNPLLLSFLSAKYHSEARTLAIKGKGFCCTFASAS